MIETYYIVVIFRRMPLDDKRVLHELAGVYTVIMFPLHLKIYCYFLPSSMSASKSSIPRRTTFGRLLISSPVHPSSFDVVALKCTMTFELCMITVSPCSRFTVLGHLWSSWASRYACWEREISTDKTVTSIYISGVRNKHR